MKNYGTIHYVSREAATESGQKMMVHHGETAVWVVEARPHVVMRVKRLFGRANVADESRARYYVPTVDLTIHGVVILQDTDEVCEDLRWVLERYPMDVPNSARLRRAAGAYRRHMDQMALLASGIHEQARIEFDLAVPARPYQVVGAEMWLAQGFLLLADPMGLGKTCTAIAGISRAMARPALVVTLTHLPRQWAREFARFAPLLKVDLFKSTKDTPDADADVTIVSYSKLAACEEGLLARRFHSVVFDEVQELRRTESGRYASAYRIARASVNVLGLSGTPIYNYGGEIFNVVDALHPGCLGTKDEFTREWCAPDPQHTGKLLVKNPPELGAYLRENFIMLRRTRKEVGRELPPSIDVVHEVEADTSRFDEDAQSAAEVLAKRIFTATFIERGQASRELDLLLRQATGLAKAPAVADFVRMLLIDGERVVLYGFHHAVYDIWRERLAEFKPVFFTGNESPRQKQEAVDDFAAGRSPLLIMSLRSGAGVDGLQYLSRIVVFGEQDWSPQVMAQCKARVDRDGQEAQVTTYYLVTDFGTDPIMAEVLGLKRGQSEGIIDLGARPDNVIVETDGQRVRKVAARYLRERGIPIDSLEPADAGCPAA